MRTRLLFLEQAGLGLGQWSFVKKVYKRLLLVLVTRLRLLVQLYVLGLDLKKAGVFLFLLVFVATTACLFNLIVECDGAFRDVSRSALLRSRLALLTFLLVNQV